MGEDGDDWIKDIHDKNKERQQADDRARDGREERRQFFEARMGDLWTGLVAALCSTIQRYNERLPDPRSAVVVTVDAGRRTFSAAREAEPAGYLDCEPKADGSEISCRYRYVNSKTGEGGRARFPTQKEEDTLRVIGHATTVDVARAILEPYLKAIG